MRIEEITDEMAEKLRLGQDVKLGQDAPQPEPSSGAGASTSAPKAATGPELSPLRAQVANQSLDDVIADLKQSPLFMTELEENDDTEALKALAYEGTALENALSFKERGNEEFRAKRWGDAREFYTKGILVLAAEERKRAEAALMKETAAEVGDSDADVAAQRAALESLYGNRAACHLELRNHRSCWLDGAAALRLNPRNVKALYRSARALLAAGRGAEADDACARGLALDEGNASLRALARDIMRRAEEQAAKQRRDDERRARDQSRALLLKAAVKARGIRTRSTAQPPEMEDAAVRLVPDPDDPRSTLSFPAVLLYPTELETDFIKAFNETEALADHLAYVFPLPWDGKGEYTLAGVECYMDTLSGGLIKVGKKVPLLKILSSGSVEVVDQVIRIYVVPKAKADAWAQEHKRKRAAERGG